MKLLVILLLTYGAWASNGFSISASSLKCAGPNCHCKETDVYWKNYNGEVPYEAFGIDDDSFYESDIFIGLGYVENVGVLPGTLHRNTSLLKVHANGKIYTICDNIMILCSKHKAKLRWMNVNIADVPFLSKSSIYTLVYGGFEQDVKLLIGRYNHEGSMEVGKVYTRDSEEEFNIINKYDELLFFDQFEILIYT